MGDIFSKWVENLKEQNTYLNGLVAGCLAHKMDQFVMRLTSSVGDAA